MGTIVVSENVSIDGVIQDPTGEEGVVPGGWFSFGRIADEDRKQWLEVLFDEARGAEALLLGRRSYEYFAARWPSRTGAYADRLNSMPKHVVSSTMARADWNNSTIVKDDVVQKVSALKQAGDGEIVVYASGGLVPALMEHDLVDEVRLTIFPLLIGTGRRLFGDTGGPSPLHLLDTRTIGEALTLLTYRRVRNA